MVINQGKRHEDKSKISKKRQKESDEMKMKPVSCETKGSVKSGEAASISGQLYLQISSGTECFM